MYNIWGGFQPEVEAERMITECDSNPSVVMYLVYRRIVREGGIDFLK